MRRGSMQGFAHHPGRLLHRWGTARLRMTLWNVAVLALILGALGSVVRYTVQANLFATVDRSLIGKAAIVYDLTNGQMLYAQNRKLSPMLPPLRNIPTPLRFS